MTDIMTPEADPATALNAEPAVEVPVFSDEAAAAVTPKTADIDASTPLHEDLQPSIDPVHYVVLDEAKVVVSVAQSNILPNDAVALASTLYAQAVSKVGRCKLVDGELVDYEPPPTPVPTPLSVPKPGLVRALMARGMWKTIKGLIAADDDTQDLWDATSTVVLTDPLTQGLIARAQLDDATVRAIMLDAIAA